MTTTQYPDDETSVGVLELQYAAGAIRITVCKLGGEPLASATVAPVYIPTKPGDRSVAVLTAHPLRVISTLGLT